MASVTLRPAADTSVESGSPNAAFSQAGDEARLIVGYNGRTGDNEWHAWTRFNLTSIPAGSTINSAILRTRIFFSQTAEYNSQSIGIYRSTNITWSEALTWNTAPSTGPILDSQTFGDSITVDVDFTVTSSVAAALASGGISLVLKPENPGAFSDLYSWLMQDDDYIIGPPPVQRPQLIVNYTELTGTVGNWLINIARRRRRR